METRARVPRIVVFSSTHCPWCSKVKKYLRENNFRFKDIDISRDNKAAQDLVRRTGQTGVPVILINNKPIVGFNRKEIDRLLKIKS